MKLEEVQIGGRYYAKVSGQIVIVRVTAVHEPLPLGWPTTAKRKRRTEIDVINERTGRKLTFRSAARLRRGVKPVPKPVSPGGGS